MVKLLADGDIENVNVDDGEGQCLFLLVCVFLNVK